MDTVFAPKRKPRVLHVAAEVAPWFKVGGLADVVGAMLKQSAAAGFDVRALVPSYGNLAVEQGWPLDADPLEINLRQPLRAHLRQVPFDALEGARLMLLDYPPAFGKEEIYWPDTNNVWRFQILSRAALDYCHREEWYPDVIHCHDWMTGLIPVYLDTIERGGPLEAAATVFTVHNLQHQGDAPWEQLGYGRLYDVYLPEPARLQHFGRLNLLKSGLEYATKLTTVSPSYAREIQTPAYGEGLEGVVQHRSQDLVGIVNGIDVAIWNPQTDAHLPAAFQADDLAGKATCKRQLQARFGLAEDERQPLFGVIARFAHQKGLDLLAEAAPALLNRHGMQLIVLGSGDKGLENAFRHLAQRYPGRVGTFCGYDESLSHLIEAGSDFFIMPSRFEPCGLNQMYSLRYGTLPIVRATGGLIDTVEPLSEGAGTGIRFEDPSVAALSHAIDQAVLLWYDQPDQLIEARRRAMRVDNSWAHSAQAYHELYHAAATQRQLHVQRALAEPA